MTDEISVINFNKSKRLRLIVPKNNKIMLKNYPDKQKSDYEYGITS